MEIKAKYESQQDIIERGSFKSRKVWVVTEDNPDYPQTIEIEVQQTKVDMFNGITPGAPVTLHLNLRGRRWTNPEGKTSVFNSLVCWKVEADASHVASSPSTPVKPAPEVDAIDDLPF